MSSKKKRKKEHTEPSDFDTIAAVITPAGQGGIGALRIAGPRARDILDQLFQPLKKSDPKPFLMRHGHFLSRSGEIVDEVLAVFMPEARSYTGLDQVEIFCHGGQQIVRLILDEIVSAGARPAEPGEFTKLAFLNGRIDLSEAEAVAEMIAASTQASYQAGREHLIGTYSKYVDELRDQLVALLADIESSIDFSDEDIDSQATSKLIVALEEIVGKIGELASSYDGGRIIREGYRVAICGRPNAGKSSLFNLLLEQERALVDFEAGTTRDYLSEWIDLDGFAVNIIDTAGFRIDAGRIEEQGQQRSQEIVAGADLILWLADLSEPDWRERMVNDVADLSGKAIILIGNKSDMFSPSKDVLSDDVLPLSCLQRTGLDRLRQTILEHINESTADLSSGHIVTSARHKSCLDIASVAVNHAREGVMNGESAEITAFELHRATDILGEITGKVYTEEILGEIFSRFCIGK